jgi:hypothetical protein
MNIVKLALLASLDRAGECWVAADVKRGQELAKVPKAKGARGGGKKHGPRGAYVEARDTAPTRAELGIGKKEAARSEMIAEAAAKDAAGRRSPGMATVAPMVGRKCSGGGRERLVTLCRSTSSRANRQSLPI